MDDRPAQGDGLGTGEQLSQAAGCPLMEGGLTPMRVHEDVGVKADHS